MANKRFDQLTDSAGVLDPADIFPKETDPTGTRVHQYVTLEDLTEYFRGRLNYNVFPTTSALRANTTHIDENVYATLGDAAKGDGYAKIYYFDEDSTATDNGGSVLKPDDITSVNPGRYLQFNV